MQKQKNTIQIDITTELEEEAKILGKLNEEVLKKIPEQLFNDQDLTERLHQLFNEIETYKIEISPNDYNGEYMKKFMPEQFLKYYKKLNHLH